MPVDDTFAIAYKYFSQGRCIIPSGGGPDGKAALIQWKPYQTAKPTKEIIQKWQKELKPAVWAMPTGSISGCFVIDADTPESVARMKELGIRPHVKTRKGAHYYCRLPSWVVSNGTKVVPGFDIRGHGGYVNFCGGNGKAHYEVMILPTDDSLYRIEQLPEELQKVLKPRRTKPATLAERILQQAVDQAHQGNRNDTGLWLACQMRDNGFSETEAGQFLQRYAAQVKNNGAEPYDESEAITSLRQAFSRPAREPWHRVPIGKHFKRFNLTDLGNAERLIGYYGEMLHYCYERKRWLVWNGKVWEWDAGDRVAALAKLAVRNIYHEAGDELDEKRRKDIANHAARSEFDPRLTGMINLAQSETGVPIKLTELDSNHWLFNCLNGTIDLKTGKLLPHQKEDLIMVLVPIDYAPDARCDLWLKFLEQVTGGDTDLVSYLQRAVGYSLTGDTRSQTMFFLYGLGSNGKSTFITTIRKLTGGYGAKANTSLFMAKEKNSGGPSEDLANLQGKRFVMASEIEDGRRLAVVLIKEMTGGELIRADRKYEHEIEFQPVHKIWLVGNHKPVIIDTTLSIWRRVKLIPFTVTIGNKEIDPELPVRLEAELPGILVWAVKGCMEWQKYGLREPKAVTNATFDYRHEQDILGDFIDDCCLLKPTAAVSKHELKAAYEEWCNNSGNQPVSQKTIRTRLIERGITEGKSGGTRYWKGITLSGAEGQQEQLGQKGQNGQVFPGNLYTKENKETFTEKPVPTRPFVPNEEIPEYPHEPCPVCGCGDYRLTDQNQWVCLQCQPEPEGEKE
jgi:putative DNA primase/helicase